MIHQPIYASDSDEEEEIIEIKPLQRKVLIYGRVQSGKTSKIMEYIKQKQTTISVTLLVIQNSLSMLAQYNLSLKQNKIKSFIVSRPNISKITQYMNSAENQKVVLIVMNNNYRRDVLSDVMSQTNVNDGYLLIMDESDLYYKSTLETDLYKNAAETVHVTATPFTSGYRKYFDEVIIIKPKPEYIGFDKLDVKLIPDVELNDMPKHIIPIIDNDFMHSREGIILVNVYSRIIQMKTLCATLGQKHNLRQVPIVMLSSKNILYYNGATKELGRMTVSQIITELEDYSHIILVANRLSTRGINFSNLSYTRHLTHQITSQNQSKTNFIQKCRILGNKTGVTHKLKLYCLNCSQCYYDNVLAKIAKVENKTKSFKVIRDANGVVIDDDDEDDDEVKPIIL